MAKGFITLENGMNFSVRWTGYDEIIRIAINELECLDNNNDLSGWLKTLIPNANEDEGDAVFHNEKGEMIVRHIDVRGLTEANRFQFWAAIENGAKKLTKFGEQYSMLNSIVMDDLISMHRSNSNNVKISEEDPEFIVIKDDIIEKVGPGWVKGP